MICRRCKGTAKIMVYAGKMSFFQNGIGWCDRALVEKIPCDNPYCCEGQIPSNEDLERARGHG